MNLFDPTASTASSYPAPRVMPGATHAFGGIWRLTVQRYFSVGHWLAVAGLLLFLGLLAIGSGHVGSGTGRYVGWSAGFYICFLVPIMAFISAAGVIRDDLGAGTVDYVFTRPVRRTTYVAFRYLAHVACAQAEFLLGLAVILGVGVYREVPELWVTLPRLLLAQVVVIVTFSAFGVLCGMLTSRYVIVGLIYGGIVEAGIGNVPTQLSRVSMLRHVQGIVQPLMSGEHGSRNQAIATDAISTLASVSLLLAAAAVFLAVTAAVFSRREFAGAAVRDS